jgi:RNA-splicing ligase RtcB
MLELNSKYGVVKIFAKTVEDEALVQITQMANSVLGENAHIRIMPDCHAGIGCVIGTTMRITNKICPNLVGVDVGCGVTLAKTDINFENQFEKLDQVIRQNIPYGHAVHSAANDWGYKNLRCWKNLSDKVQSVAMRSLGTLGGGNHFIEAYKDGYIAVHSGSRNIGYETARYYQKLAESSIKKQNISIDKDLAYLTGQDMKDYLRDMMILQDFAHQNRLKMLRAIAAGMGGEIKDITNSTHNYIDIKRMVLRKGAISAEKGQLLLIPLNMRDGMLICEGRGNPDWNWSAPHGAGRLYSRAKAKQIFSLEDYKESTKGIFSTCVNKSTLDEAPFAYKDYQEIIKYIEPAVKIIKKVEPIYNFKAN